MSSETSGLSRRTLAKGTAWAVPAVAVAAAAPVYAVSGTVDISSVYESCKHPGSGAGNDFPKGYHIQFVFVNTTSEIVTVTIPGLVSLTGGTGSSQTACVPNGNGASAAGAPLVFTVPANQTGYHVVVHYYSNSSANVTISSDYSYASESYSGTDSFSYALSGDPCQSTGQGIPNDHACGGGTGTQADPRCINSPAGACPTSLRQLAPESDITTTEEQALTTADEPSAAPTEATTEVASPEPSIEGVVESATPTPTPEATPEG